MKRLGVLAATLALLVTTLPAAADNAPAERDNLAAAGTTHNLEHPLGIQQAELHAEAIEASVSGKADGPVYQAGNGRYVELEREDTDQVLVMLGEFGDQVDPQYGGAPGPSHNEIAEPELHLDNTTIWQDDYDVDHYEDMYFDRMVDYLYDQSSGRYSIEGEVQDWAEVPYNSARYGNNACGGIVCSTVWDFLRDTSTSWYDDQLAAGASPDDLAEYLQRYDVWDRYDQDGDGDFDEPDGYIDHFQIVHAGVGEETGGGAQGSDAIWSHRWYTYFQGIGSVGPDGYAPQGGYEIGDTNLFVGDYTIQPENGGLGVFAHEYMHDLGLPDLYDTAGGENGTGFWTLMSSGSYLGKGETNIGDNPGDLMAWEKLQLGWLDYDVVVSGQQQRSWHKLGPAEFNNRDPQALVVILPDRERASTIAVPPEGAQAWYSGSGDDLDNTMTTMDAVSIPDGGGEVTLQLWRDIEVDWDYGYIQASNDDGITWANLAGETADGDPITTNDNPNGQNFGNGFTGASDGWEQAVFDASAFAGQDVLIRARYWTDVAVANPGFMVDDIAVGDFASGAEAGDDQWELDGFTRTTGSEVDLTFNAYVAEARRYKLNDRFLKTGPYNFSFLDRPDYVQHFPYQDGLLISYWDDYHTDNNTSQHPGEGLILPVDARPEPLIAPDGSPWRNRVQMYDATFARQKSDPIELAYTDGVTQWGNATYRGTPWVSTFDDSRSYWSPETPGSSVQLLDTDTRIAITRQNRNTMTVRVSKD